MSASTDPLLWQRDHVGPHMDADGSTLLAASGAYVPGIGVVAGVEAVDLATGATKWLSLAPNPLAYYVRVQMAVGQGADLASFSLGNVDYLTSFDEATGKVRWYGSPEYGGGVTYAAGQVFTHGSSCSSVALDASTGLRIWQAEMSGNGRAPIRRSSERVWSMRTTDGI